MERPEFSFQSTKSLTQDVGSGCPSAQAVERIMAVQFTNNLLMLDQIGGTLQRHPRILEYGRETPREVANMQDDLHRTQKYAQATSNDAFRNVMTYPLVGACITEHFNNLVVKQQAEQSESIVPRSYGALLNLGIAASMACGIAIEDRKIWLTPDGSTSLPTFGLIRRIERSKSNATATLVYDRSDGMTIWGNAYPLSYATPDLTQETEHWEPVPHLQFEQDGLTLNVALDNLDPWCKYFDGALRHPLSGEEIEQWQEVLAAGWRTIVRRYPEYAPAMTQGLRAIVPLDDRNGTFANSLTTSIAVGAIGMTKPPDGETATVDLIHEFLHNVLAGFNRMTTLFSDPKRATETLGYSGWRDDPRPLVGHINGAYAHLGIAEYWRRRLDEPASSDDERLYVQVQAARWAQVTHEGARHFFQHDLPHIYDYNASPPPTDGPRITPGTEALSEVGRDIGHHMSQAAWKRWGASNRDNRITPEARAISDDLIDDHRATWNIYNRTPKHPEHAAILARMLAEWHVTLFDLVQVEKPELTITPFQGNSPAGNRRFLLELRLTDPEQFQRITDGEHEIPGKNITAGDIAFAEQQYEDAYIAYCSHITTHPDDKEAWAGLVLCEKRLGRVTPDMAYHVFNAMPEETFLRSDVSSFIHQLQKLYGRLYGGDVRSN